MHLNLDSVAAHGNFNFNKETQKYDFINGNRPATAFLFKLIFELQFSPTVPMMDIQSYAQLLTI